MYKYNSVTFIFNFGWWNHLTYNSTKPHLGYKVNKQTQKYIQPQGWR